MIEKQFPRKVTLDYDKFPNGTLKETRIDTEDQKVYIREDALDQLSFIDLLNATLEKVKDDRTGLISVQTIVTDYLERLQAVEDIKNKPSSDEELDVTEKRSESFDE